MSGPYGVAMKWVKREIRTVFRRHPYATHPLPLQTGSSDLFYDVVSVSAMVRYRMKRGIETRTKPRINRKLVRVVGHGTN